MSENLPVYQPRNSMMIKNLCPGLMELGKIKIGNKGKARKSQSGTEWQPPQKLDYFLITTMQRGEDGNFLLDERLHKQFNPTGDRPIRSIPVRLIYDDISLNFATRYICYYGKTVFCSGDGEFASRMQRDGTVKQIACTCPRQDPKYTGDDGPAGPEALGGKNGKGKCKINGILSVIIDGAPCVGGVWKFRTTSYNSVVGILSSLALIQRITGGRLAGIPLTMTVTPKTVQDPVQGSQQTIYVVGLQYAGTIDSLRDTGYQIAMVEAKHGISMSRIEEDARLMLSHAPAAGLGDDIAEDVIEEFYPEEAMNEAGPVVVDEKTAETVVENTHTEPPKRERGKPSPGNKRRTAAEVEEDRLADEAEKVPVETPQKTTQVETVDEQTGEVIGGTVIDDDDFPDPPGTAKQEQQVAPVAKTANAKSSAGSCPDLF